jgi:hypothetical protein
MLRGASFSVAAFSGETKGRSMSSEISRVGRGAGAILSIRRLKKIGRPSGDHPRKLT